MNQKTPLVLLALVLGGTRTGPAWANSSQAIEQVDTSRAPASVRDSDFSSFAIRNWSNVRSWLGTRGVEIVGSYKGDIMSCFDGGIKRQPEALGLFDLGLSFDFEKSLGFRGTSAFFQGNVAHGGDPSRSIGDVQQTSNIEALDSVTILSAWVEQSFLGGDLRILAGLYDLNSEFYVSPSAGIFLNGSFGAGAEIAISGENGPSMYPATSLGVRIKTQPSATTYVQAVLLDGVPGDPTRPSGTHIRWNSSEGFLSTFEGGYRERSSKLAVGAWTYTSRVSRGAYILGERALISGVSGFLRYGVSTGTPFGSCLAVGANLAGKYGIAATWARPETTFELTYRWEVAEGIVLQPDLQRVIAPGSNPDLPAAWVGGLRLEVSL